MLQFFFSIITFFYDDEIQNVMALQKARKGFTHANFSSPRHAPESPSPRVPESFSVTIGDLPLSQNFFRKFRFPRSSFNVSNKEKLKHESNTKKN